MPKAGESVQISGIYKCDKCGNEQTHVKGHTFPPCAKCNCPNCTLVRATH